MDIHISNLTKHYGSVRALSGITLQIEHGMFGLLGPNGSGKTTLMRILATTLAPTSGQILIDGVDVVRDPGAVRRQLGYLPQDFGFYGQLTAYEMLDYIAAMKNIPPRERRRHVELVLADVNLLGDARRRIDDYSGGMRQRLGIAQALLGNPALLVVDEPTAGLDPEERIRFRNLLVRLARQCTVLLSTHVVADIEASCTRLAVLRTGQLAFYGTRDQLLAAARGRLWQLLATPDEAERLDPAYHVVASRPHEQMVELRVLADENPLGRGVPLEPGLEDGYIAVMHQRAMEVVNA